MEGTVTLSIEIELGWGLHKSSDYDHLSLQANKEKGMLNILLDFCDEKEIPISFDIVGHLFEESCSGQHSGPYPYNWWNNDPGTDAETDPLFYSPDMMRSIMDAEVNHEICTHTYSHVLCDEISKEVLDTELKKVKELHDRWGLDAPSSIVFPKHQNNYYGLLEDHGIQTVRCPMTNHMDTDHGIVKQYYWILKRTPPITNLTQSNNITETYSTPYPSLTYGAIRNSQSDLHPAFEILPLRTRQWLHTRNIRASVDQVVNTGDYLHLWTHLHNMSNIAQWKPIRRGVNYISEKNKNNDITINRMCDLNE